MSSSNGPPVYRAPSIEVTNLSNTFSDGSHGLHRVTLSLPAHSRTLLIGANGAGKTTLLRLLAGKVMALSSRIAISGVDPFKEGLEGVTYLGAEWVLNPIVRMDIDVNTLLASVGGNHYPDRRDELVSILDIDVAWRMHAVSDGERRRVQLAMGLLPKWRVLLLDEITVDLDMLSRSNFLTFLAMETSRRPCTIVYATHIFDNLATWPTHLVHMHLGKVKDWGPAERFNIDRNRKSDNSQLSDLVLSWLKEDQQERGPRNRVKSQAQTYRNVIEGQI